MPFDTSIKIIRKSYSDNVSVSGTENNVWSRNHLAETAKKIAFVLHTF